MAVCLGFVGDRLILKNPKSIFHSAGKSHDYQDTDETYSKSHREEPARLPSRKLEARTAQRLAFQQIESQAVADDKSSNKSNKYTEVHSN